MTNTLTWGFRPIQLPKLNSNLLSTISFFMLCLMLFTTGAAIVEAVCESEYSALQWTELAYGAAYVALAAAEVAIIAALASLNPLAIAAALLAVDLAAIALTAAGANLAEKQTTYEDCLNQHTAGGGGSGGCSG